MKFFLFMTVVLLVSSGGCSKFETSNIPAVKNFDIRRYCGKWYEIARLPNWFECGMSGVTANYSLLPDGRVKVVNQGWRNGKAVSKNGTARFADEHDRGELDVSFQWPFWGSYRIIDLNRDYSIAVVCGSSRKYLWVLSRTPEISREELDRVLEFIRAHGFDIYALEFPRKQRTIN